MSRAPLRRSALAAILMLPLVCASGAARGDDTSDPAEAHVQRGIELRTEGRDREALESFRAADALRSTPRTRAQVALAQQAVGDWVAAEAGLEAALRERDDPWILRYRAALESALTTVRGHLAWIMVDAEAPGATVSLNGGEPSPLPLTAPLRVASGNVVIDVHAPGYLPAERVIALAAESQAREAFALQPLVPPLVLEPSADAWAAGARDGAPLPPPKDGARRVAGWVTLGAAGALAAGGVAAWLVREHDVAVYNDDSRCRVGALTRAEQCGRYASGANLAEALQVGAFASAGVGALVGAWLLFGSPSHASPARTSCAPALGAGVACAGTF